MAKIASRSIIRLFNFKKQFKPHIKSGRKQHTIRGKRRYPAKPGDTLHLYTGFRTYASPAHRAESL